MAARRLLCCWESASTLAGASRARTPTVPSARSCRAANGAQSPQQYASPGGNRQSAPAIVDTPATSMTSAVPATSATAQGSHHGENTEKTVLEAILALRGFVRSGRMGRGDPHTATAIRHVTSDCEEAGMISAVYAGSFDPPTAGHDRGLGRRDKVVGEPCRQLRWRWENQSRG